MAPVHLPSCVVVFRDKHTLGSLKAFVADGLSQGPLLRIWFFLVFLTVGFFLGFWQMLSFGCESLVYVVVVFSARALGAGFRPGFFYHSFHHLDDGLDWVEVCCGHILWDACYFCTYYFGLRPHLETKFKI